MPVQSYTTLVPKAANSNRPQAVLQPGQVMALPSYFIVMLIFLAGLPLLSESIYTPVLTTLAQGLDTSIPMAEYTLSVYLYAFGVGVLFWGNLSDKWGRKPCYIAGFSLYILGCAACWLAPSIEVFMGARVIQAFGCSVGSVLSQAVARDVYKPPLLGKAFATVGASLAFAPAIGPVLGGFLGETSGWRSVFLMLCALGALALVLILWRLPETHDKSLRRQGIILSTLQRLIRDKQTLFLGLIIGGSSGVLFSYMAEGPYFFITAQDLTPRDYGLSFFIYAAGGVLGGWLCRYYHELPPTRLVAWGIGFILAGSLVMLGGVTALAQVPELLLYTSFLGMFIFSIGCCMVSSTSLGMALQSYGDCRGTAGSLFGMYYYIIIAGFTVGMGTLHNGQLTTMPLYFCGIAVLMALFLWLYKGACDREQSTLAA